MTANRSLSASLERIGRALLAGDAALPDAELVGRFADRRDEAAFAALVRRHGAMVLTVCRRVLRNEHDAEDAFQAAFLVLARNAASVRRAGAVGNWLYGVAFNVARKARAVRQRRSLKEREAAALRPVEMPPAAGDDLREVIDAELHALPDKYRAPIVLCDLMGLTTQEAAAQVGCLPKTLGTRLSRGRSLLAGRLARKGLGVGCLAAAVGPAATAAVPPRLIEVTARAAVPFAAGSTASVAPAVAALTHGVCEVMLPRAFKYALVVACGVVAAGVLVAAHLPAPADGSDAPSVPAKQESSAPTGSAPASRTSGQPSLLAHLDHLHRVIIRMLGIVPVKHDKGGKDDPALSGVWVHGGNDPELKIEFSGKDVLKVHASHGENGLILTCRYSAEEGGRLRARITDVEDKGIDVKDRLPVGLEFTFRWTVKDQAATLDDLKGDNAELLKAHLEGDYESKR